MKKDLLSQTRLFMIQCLMTMILAFSFNSAHAQYGQNIETTQSHIGQYLSQGSHVQLMQRLRISQGLRAGKELLAIRVIAQSNSYDAKLILKLNGQKIDSKTLSSYSNETILTTPRLQPNDTLSIKVKGSVYVEKILADLKRPSSNQGNGGINQNGVVKVSVRVNSRGTQIHNIKRMIKQNSSVRLQGKKLKKVIIKASSNAGNGQATLLINGYPVGYSQNIPRYASQISFNLNNMGANRFGQGINKVELKIRGNVQIKMVGMKVSQSNNGGGYGNSVAINVNQAFYGSQRISLARLVQNGPRINTTKQIESITITARGRGIINIAGAGRGQGGIQVQGPTTRTLRVMGYTSVRDLMLRIKATRNNLVIEQVRIKFKSVY